MACAHGNVITPGAPPAPCGCSAPALYSVRRRPVLQEDEGQYTYLGDNLVLEEAEALIRRSTKNGYFKPADFEIVEVKVR